MATAKKTTTKPVAKKAAPVKATKPAKTVKAPAPKAAPKAAPAAAAKPVVVKDLKPIKTALSKTDLVAHLAQVSLVEPKAVKAVVAALEATMLASVSKKGLGSFTMPGLLKVNVINVPAKKKRRGIDPFTKVERDFPAKKATVKLKVRSLKKLKDAAL
ncbi:MAG TPA: HU family DNA-binding protein [Methylibium sp.]|nr:HU family DNA-binding protein [Methylibium sp.]